MSELEVIGVSGDQTIFTVLNLRLALNLLQRMTVHEMGFHYGANIGRQLAHEVGGKFIGTENHTGMYFFGQGASCPILSVRA